MRLILTLTEGGASVPDRDKARTLTSSGGTGTLSIGRGSDNDWILPNPDKTLSRQHCVISFDGEGFVLTDKSQSGVIVNNAGESTERDSVTPLKDGDEFRIASFAIAVTVVNDSPALAPGGRDPAGRGGDPFGGASGVPAGDPFGAPVAASPFGRSAAAPSFGGPAAPSGAARGRMSDPLTAPAEGPPRGGRGLSGPNPLGGDPFGGDLNTPFAAPPTGLAGRPAVSPSAPNRRGLDPFAKGDANSFDPLEQKADRFDGRPADRVREWEGPSRADHASPMGRAVAPSKARPAGAGGGKVNFDALIGDVDLPGQPPAAPAATPMPAAPRSRDPFHGLNDPLDDGGAPRPAEPSRFDAAPARPMAPAARGLPVDLDAPLQPTASAQPAAPAVRGLPVDLDVPLHPAAPAQPTAAAARGVPFDLDEPLHPTAPGHPAAAPARGLPVDLDAPLHPTGPALPTAPTARAAGEDLDTPLQPAIPSRPAAPSAAPVVRPVRPAQTRSDDDTPPELETLRPFVPGGAAPGSSPFDEPGAEPAHPVRASAPVPAAAVSPSAGGLDAVAALEAFLDGAGLTGRGVKTENPEAKLRAAGQIFRAMAEGLRQVLISRASVKSELGVEQTMISGAGNNALKFSVTPEDAVRLLLSPEIPGYKDPVKAAREASEDIMAHELAVMAGVQMALLAVLKRFDPDELEKRMTPSGMASLLPAARKARLWDVFKMTYEDIAREAEDEFKTTVFGRSFARAYAAQSRKE